MTALRDELMLLSDAAPRADAARLTRAAIAGAGVRRRRVASFSSLAAVGLLALVVLVHQRMGTHALAAVGAGSSELPSPGVPGAFGRIPSARHDLITLIVGALLGLALTGLGARIRRDPAPVAVVERLVGAVWGATAGAWSLSAFRLFRAAFRSGSLASGWPEISVSMAVAASMGVLALMVLGSQPLRRLGLLAAAAVAVVEVGAVVRPLADLGYWFDSGYWSAVWPQPLLVIRTLIGFVALGWLSFAPLGLRRPSRWWLAGGCYALVVAGVRDVLPHLGANPSSYAGETWAALVAGGAAGLAGIALALHLRKAPHPMSAAVVVAVLVAYTVPFFQAVNLGGLWQQQWQLLPDAVTTSGVVLLLALLLVWARDRRRLKGG